MLPIMDRLGRGFNPGRSPFVYHVWPCFSGLRSVHAHCVHEGHATAVATPLRLLISVLAASPL